MNFPLLTKEEWKRKNFHIQGTHLNESTMDGLDNKERGFRQDCNLFYKEEIEEGHWRGITYAPWVWKWHEQFAISNPPAIQKKTKQNYSKKSKSPTWNTWNSIEGEESEQIRERDLRGDQPWRGSDRKAQFPIEWRLLTETDRASIPFPFLKPKNLYLSLSLFPVSVQLVSLSSSVPFGFCFSFSSERCLEVSLSSSASNFSQNALETTPFDARTVLLTNSQTRR